MNYTLIRSITVAFLLSFILCRFFIAFSKHLTLFNSQKTANRWSSRSISQLGGVAIFLSSTLSMIWFFDLSQQEYVLWFGASSMFLIGLLDDLIVLPAYIKLIFQLIVASFMCYGGIHMTATQQPFIYYPVSILWIVGIANAVNLMDNMDGLAGGTSVIILSSIYIASFFINGSYTPVIVLPLIGALTAFLHFNIRPAAIFMGDSGSLFIGSFLAGITILDDWKSVGNTALSLLFPVLLLAVPIFETFFVSVNRRVHGIPISIGGKDHLSHRLVKLGFNERNAVYFLWLISLLFGMVSILSISLDLAYWILPSVFLLTCLFIFAVVVKDLNIYQYVPPSSTSRGLPTNIMHKRRIFEILLDASSIALAYIIAYFLRYDWHIDDYYWSQMAVTITPIFGIKLIAMLASGLYRGLFVYLNFDSGRKIFFANLAASIVSILYILVWYRFESFSRSLFLIDFAFCTIFMTGSRALLRYLKEKIQKRKESINVACIGFDPSQAKDISANLAEKGIYVVTYWSPEDLENIREHPEKSLSLLKTIEANQIEHVFMTHQQGMSARSIKTLNKYFGQFNILLHQIDSVEDTITRRLSLSR